MNKKIILSFLALNAVTSIYSSAANTENYDNLYGKIVKNLSTGKSNEKNYKLIEEILNKRNKELKDLYLQGDYIVKPEYLEWQIFFSGFYNENNRGGSGTEIRPLNMSQEPKTVDLGISIPITGITRDSLDLNITEKTLIVITSSTPNINVVPVTVEKDFIMQSFQPIPEVSAPDLSKISINWPRSNGTVATTTVNGTNEVNSGTLTYTVDSTSGIMNKAGVYINKGSYTNDGKIEIDYNGIGNTGGTVTRINTFHGILNQNRYINGLQLTNPISFTNNGEFNVFTNIADNGGDVGSVMGIHYYSGSYIENTKIENYGTARVKQAVWMQFEDTEGEYISHDSNGRVGNVIVEDRSQGLQIWRCCFTDTRDMDTLAKLDPGIIVVRGDSTGINIVEGAAAMRTEVQNYNTSGDVTKDSQVIVESGNGVVFTISTNTKTGLKEEVNIPIYLTNPGTAGLVVIDGVSNPGGGWSLSGAGNSVVHIGTGGKIEIRTAGNSTDRTTGIYTNAVQALDNEGTVSNITNSVYSLTLNDGTALSYNNYLGSENTVGVYIEKGRALNTQMLSGETTNDIHYRQNGGSIKIGGKNSVALYNNKDIVKITNNAVIEASDGAVGIYTKGTGTTGSATTRISNAHLIAGSNSLLFYNENGGQIDFQGPTTAEIKENGIAFYSKGNVSLSDYLNVNNFTVKMDEDSILLMLESPLTPSYLSSLPGVTGINIDPTSSTNFKKLVQYRGDFFIDKDSNLDDISDDYVQISLISTDTTLEAGKKIIGTKDKQVGIKSAGNSVTLLSDVSSKNDGLIDLTGNNTVGLYTDFGTNTNTTLGVVNVTGSNGIGMFAENGSITSNTGNINIGSSGIGIYGVSYQDLSNIQVYGTGKIDVTNNGTITAGTGTQAMGIYINNNKPSTTVTDANLSLGTGTINVANSTNGVGVYVNKATVTGGGSITVGKNGVGFYANDSNVNLSSMTMNLHGDNALGFYLEGTTDFIGSGIIDVDGKNVTLFNANSVPGSIFTNNFNVTSTSGSTYVLGILKNGAIEYGGTANLSSGGTLITGVNSTILLNGSAVINSVDNNVIGISLDGQGIPNPSWGTSADGTNRGTITLGNTSIGMYGVNGVRYQNDNILSLGTNSVGIFTSGSGSYAKNNGDITVGENSQGIYIENSVSAENSAGKKIVSTGESSVGIYSNSTLATLITNDGEINLSGDKSVGIYTKGSGTQVITNNGILNIGNSSSVNDPSIGIYSYDFGTSINNFGTISTGISSIGIYNNQGTVNHDGILNVGTNGTGIYSNGGTTTTSLLSTINMSDNNTVGVYADNGASIINNSQLNIGKNNYGVILSNGSSLVNNTSQTLIDNSVLVYGINATSVTNFGTVTMSGSNNIGFYQENGGSINNTANIYSDSGKSNIVMYNNGGSINNTGDLTVGDTVIVKNSDGSINYNQSKYAVGIYGENSVINNSGNIDIGENGVGLYTKNNTVAAINTGNITSAKNGAIGLFAERGEINNSGNITLNGENSMGIVANTLGKVTNTGTITINGENSVGIYANVSSTIDNQGIINMNANRSTGIQLSGNSTLINTGTMNIAGGISGTTSVVTDTDTYSIPSLVNAGVINVSENFDLRGLDISIKIDPSTIREATSPEDLGAKFVSDAVKFYAPNFVTGGEVVGILPDFTQGTNASVYKFKDVFNPSTPDGGPNTGLISIISKSLTWTATPDINSNGNVDIWMQKLSYDSFAKGLWYEDFSKSLDEKYEGASGDAGKIFDKIDSIEEEEEYRHVMTSLAGNVYANMNQREETIAGVLGTSLNLLQDSKNNTKENVKINIIAGKGTLSENTDGVVGYDYETTGVLALREVERTYKHTFGYSLGYLHTNFEFKDGNNSEEDADTIQLGAHSKYRSNDWILRNDLTGRVSIHNIDRNVDWSNSGRSEMNGKYEAYSITSDNNLGKELSLGKNATVTPYGGLEATYVTRPTFTESGLESLEVKGNDAWSVKPKVGVELKASTNESKNGWKLKGALDISYGYELADLNEREYAKLTALESDYHKLSKPEENKGVLKTKAIVGAEIEDRYGIFLTGEYSVGEHNQDDYRAGVTLKAVF